MPTVLDNKNRKQSFLIRNKFYADVYDPLDDKLSIRRDRSKLRRRKRNVRPYVHRWVSCVKELRFSMLCTVFV
ncbi:hypothetical protein K2173_022094 [Erythroxylum novogranatense]|uniref:Uncharacterized protein n=1 Tax=Erythroxylum novogranatense TaxID=1862640 RepID=A0AAV8TVB1_9ROSI|nr:hypothetical protein K2173_022094 [Erythroxylum novogranatense]